MRVAIVGDPVEHSLSPMQNAAFASAGLKWEMIRVRVPAGGGADVINRVRAGEFAGLAVTMPLKEEAARSVDDLMQHGRVTVGEHSGWNRLWHVAGLAPTVLASSIPLYAQDIALTGARVHLLEREGLLDHCRCARCN